MAVRYLRCLIAATPLVSGCSVVLDTGDLPHGGPADAAPFDADRTAFSITAAEPSELLEGAGAKGRPVVVRFAGTNVVDPTVTASWSDGFADPITIVELQPSRDYNELAVALRVPVRDQLDEGACAGVTIHVDFAQIGATPAAIDLPLHCLDELTDPSQLDSNKTYSRIQITTDHAFAAGDSGVAVLRATEDIAIGAVLAVDADHQTAGRGSSCNGGPVGGQGQCTGGGAPGNSGGTLAQGGGGSGGGYATDGNQGQASGTAGASHGNALLVPLGPSSTGNASAGGGGGGTGFGGSAGAGGGGGGAIELIAGGEVVVSTGALVRARGGDGGGATGNGATGSGGSGGGGSGGTILVRAAAGVRFVDSPFAWLAAPHGARGTPIVTNGGGDGADGRIRVDQPVASPGVGAMVSAGSAGAGPAWDPATPVIATGPATTLVLHAQAGTYGVLVNGAAIDAGGGNVTIVSGSIDVPVEHLDRGHNEICALYAAIGSPDTDRDEAQTCVDVVYVPE